MKTSIFYVAFFALAMMLALNIGMQAGADEQKAEARCVCADKCTCPADACACGDECKCPEAACKCADACKCPAETCACADACKCGTAKAACSNTENCSARKSSCAIKSLASGCCPR